MLESGEMYLENILLLGRERTHFRAIDLGEYMGFSKPSVSRALKKLKADDCIAVDQEGFLTLTERGRGIAEKIYERHVLLSEMLIAMGVDEETARADACKIEHDLSDASFEALKKHFLKEK